MQLLFGIGALWGVRSDVTGIGPDQFAVLQDNSVDFQFEIKELYSQLGWPIDIARGKGKITGKAKMARVFGALYADLFFGASVSTGEDNVSENETYTLAAATQAVAHSTGFVADLGVFYASGAALRFNYSTAAPSALASYSVSAAGVYTFFTGDIGAAIAISYVYTDATGKTITITNNYMGFTPTFIGTFYQSRNTQGSSGQLTLRLNECVSSHLSIPSRIDDYAIPDFDYQAFSNASNTVGTLSTTE